MKRALVIGALGQDGAYLTDLLLRQGYEVIGTSHRAPDPETAYAGQLRRLDLASFDAIRALLSEIRPDEVYNLAARASSAQLFDDAIQSGDINGLAVARFLEALHQVAPHARFCQALSSEIFAGATESPQTEATPVSPCNAYGAAKVYARHMVGAYRDQRGLFACGAILYNHESPLRPPHFVTRKVARAVARIARGSSEILQLGPAENRRDWGHARDHVRALHLMLQRDEPQDFIVATGATHSVAQLCETAFAAAGLDYRRHVVFADIPGRRAENCELRGDAGKARRLLGWSAETSFGELIREMVEAELLAAQPGETG
jgi:GDPmannose 4,6-dehydratase